VKVKYTKIGLQAAIEAGDPIFGVLRWINMNLCTLMKGTPLADVLDLCSRGSDYTLKSTMAWLNDVFRGIQAFVKNIQGKTLHRTTYNSDDFIQEDYEARMQKSAPTLAFVYYWNKVKMHFVNEDYEGAATAMEQFQIYVPYCAIMAQSADFYFYAALLEAAHRPSARDAVDPRFPILVGKLSAGRDKLKTWADSCPDNYLGKYLLVCAEAARLDGHDADAIKLYDQAIDACRQSRFLQDEALAQELCAKFCLSKGWLKIAALYLTEARYTYLQWGATGKVQDLEAKCSALLSAPVLAAPRSGPATALGALSQASSTSISTGTQGDFLDVYTFVQAAHALSSELVLGKVLDRLMHLVLENAGAQRGFLLLLQDDALFVEASMTAQPKAIELGLSLPLESVPLARSVVQYVARTQEPVVLAKATLSDQFAADSYILREKPKSLLALALVYQGSLTGVLYLENNLVESGFPPARLELLRLLSSQAAIAIENARLYARVQASSEALRRANETLEQQVEERTAELKAAKEVAEGAKELADRANQAKSEFLASMSHELRTPLNGILGYAQILTRTPELPDKVRDSVRVIRKSGEHLLTLINDVLDLAKVEAGKIDLAPKDLLLPAFVRTVTQLVRIRAEEKGISLDCDFQGPADLTVRVDERRLTQVMLNLLGNAIKFTAEGHVQFRIFAGPGEGPGAAGAPAEPPAESPTELPAESIVRFEVEDTGPGIAAEDLRKIFEPFEQVGDAKKRAEGTGLGLAITKKLVEGMGGAITVASALGKGSTFTVTLPLQRAARALEEEAESWDQLVGYKGPRQRVLVVDDHEENRVLVRELLGPIGFEIEEAADGVQALSLVEKQAPSVVIMDLRMPGTDGFEVTRRMRQLQALSNTVIVATSASVSEADFRRSSAVGCSDFIPKPLEVRSLLHVLQRRLGLEWVRRDKGPAAASGGEMVLGSSKLEVSPHKDQVAPLLQLAQRGRIRQVLEELERLEQQEPALIPWLRRVRQLAKGYQVSALREHLAAEQRQAAEGTQGAAQGPGGDSPA